jgi:hypothetical protein
MVNKLPVFIADKLATSQSMPWGSILLLLILPSFDWLAAFHLELLQAILFIAVQLSAALSTAVEVFPQPFFLILLLQGRLLPARYAYLYALSICGVCFLKFPVIIFLLSHFKKLPFIIPSVHFIFNILFQQHVSN